MRRTAVTKMHGTYNDFVLIDGRSQEMTEYASLARAVCDRRGGIGADGLLVVLASARADARMRIFNADGSEAEMCGNGMRCVVRYLHECGEGEQFRIETLGGTIGGKVLRAGEPYDVRLTLGVPSFEPCGLDASMDVVMMGNPHAVLFVSSLTAIDLAERAASLQTSAAFPNGTNVHAVAPAGKHRIDVAHWERGVGMTRSCGTGSAASAAAAIARGVAESPVDVHVPGGVLRVEWDGRGAAFLSGPASRIFDAELDLARLG
jgi:diaminopimelate epimerase